MANLSGGRLEGPLPGDRAVAHDAVALLPVVEVVKGDTALGVGAHLADIVLHPPQLEQLREGQRQLAATARQLRVTSWRLTVLSICG